MSLEIFQFPYRQDNYGVLVHDPVSGSTACVDAGSEGAEAELAALAETGWTLSQLWITHHHPDHVAGLEALKAATGCAVFGPQGSAQPIKGIDHYLAQGDRFRLGAHDVQVLHTPGHTLDMLNYYLANDAILFSGDTLFAMGCGRIFEGTPAIMYDSMMALKALPGSTQVYCSHEYSQANATFALSIDPNNAALISRMAEVKARRAQGLPTVPTTIKQEWDTNPYFRCDNEDIRASLNLAQATDAEVFAEIRKRKDTF